jgi:hypothetical protein
MKQTIALRSVAAGVGIGTLSAGGMWWAEGFLDGSFVLIAAVSAVWAAAIASAIYISQSHPGHRDESPWTAVVGGSLLFGVVLNLSDISISNDASAAVTALVIGFTLLGYNAGMATVYRQNRGSHTTDTTVADD